MEQTFQYPNLLVNSRSGTLHLQSVGKNLPGVRMRDGVVGDYQRVTLDADAKGWAYLYMHGAEGVGDVPEGTNLAISLFARVNGGPCRLYPAIRLSNSTGIMHDWGTTTWDDVGGGVDSLRHEGASEFGRVQLADTLRQPRPRQGGDHVRRRAADGLRCRRAARMGASEWGGVA